MHYAGGSSNVDASYSAAPAADGMGSYDYSQLPEAKRGSAQLPGVAPFVPVLCLSPRTTPLHRRYGEPFGQHVSPAAFQAAQSKKARSRVWNRRRYSPLSRRSSSTRRASRADAFGLMRAKATVPSNPTSRSAPRERPDTRTFSCTATTSSRDRSSCDKATSSSSVAARARVADPRRCVALRACVTALCAV